MLFAGDPIDAMLKARDRFLSKYIPICEGPLQYAKPQPRPEKHKKLRDIFLNVKSLRSKSFV